MNLDDLFSAIGTASEEQLAHSEKPSSRLLRTLLPIAACFCLLLPVVLLYKDPAKHYISTEVIDWYHPQIAEQKKIDDDVYFAIANTALPDYQFIDMSIEAKVLEVLPDLYTEPGATATSTRYHILHLKVLDRIVGKNMPDEIYYLIPSFLSPDLQEYDSLIMVVTQRGWENYVMINETQHRAEVFSFLFDCGRYDPDQGGVLAFKNGKLDTGLWKKEGWDYNKEGYTPERLLSEDFPHYPGKPNRTPFQVKQVIHQVRNKYLKVLIRDKRSREMVDRFYTVRTIPSLSWPEAKQLLEYVQPFTNGTFINKANYKDTITYIRYINGIPTDEIYYLNFKEKRINSPNSVRYTEEELAQLPDAPSIIKQLSEEAPRIIVDQYTGKEMHFIGISAAYEKKDDGIYCRLKAMWREASTEKSRLPSDLIIVWSGASKNQSYLIHPDGTLEKVS